MPNKNRKNSIRVLLNKGIKEELKKSLLSETISPYHCVREFMQECVDAYEASERNDEQYKKEGDAPLAASSKIIPITRLQRSYLLSQEADEVFATPILADLLASLRKYSLSDKRND